MISLFSSNYDKHDFLTLQEVISNAVDEMFKQCSNDEIKGGAACLMCDHKEACADLLRFERYLVTKTSGE